MKASVGISRHANATRGALEAVASATAMADESVPPDLLWLVSVHHSAEHTQDALAAACERTGARNGIACTAGGVFVNPGGIEVEREASVGVLLIHGDPALDVFSARTRRPAWSHHPLAMLIDGDVRPAAAARTLQEMWDPLRVAGGGAVGLRSDAAVYHQGFGPVEWAVIGPGTDVVEVGVAQGCAALGEPMVISRAEGNLVLELDKRPALARVLEQLSPSERRDAARSLGKCMVGLTDRDAGDDAFQRGRYSVRALVGVAPDIGAVAIGESPSEGSTLSLLRRDGAQAERALHAMIADVKHRLGGSAPVAALYFSCVGRGSKLFGRAHVEGEALARAFGRVPLLGMSSAFEFGPALAGAPGVHMFCGVLMVLARGS